MSLETHTDRACLIGPTASGKSAIALAIAERARAEIVSLDSMQVYRRMDIGTAKPGRAERARVRHHMLDLVEPSERYDVHRYLEELAPVLADIRGRGRRALVVGGTAFYLKALSSGLFRGPPVDRELRARVEARVRELGNAAMHGALGAVDPRAAARIHVNDTKRLVRALEIHEQTGRPLSDWQTEWSADDGTARSGIGAEPLSIVGLDLDVPTLDARIRERTRAMLAAGWPEEAAAIRASTGFGPTSIQALGYARALELADGRVDAATCADDIALATRQFARRQRTWYRKFTHVRWFRSDASPQDEPPAQLVSEILDALAWS